jgi:hypothetical protein
MFSVKNKKVYMFLIILSFLLVSTAIFAVDKRDLPSASKANFQPQDISSQNEVNEFFKSSRWGGDVTIAKGPVSGGISTDYDTAGNLYAARCSTWVGKGNFSQVVIYKSTNNGASWFNRCQYGPFGVTLSYPVILTGSIGNRLYLFVRTDQDNGDIFVVRFKAQTGGFETSQNLAPGPADTISYFTACTNMGRGDTLVVVYQKDRTGGTPYLYSTMSTDYGVHWSTPQNQSGDGEHPDIAYGQAGNVYLTYHKTIKDDIAFLRGKTYETGPWNYVEYLTTDSTSHHDDFPKIAALHTFPADTATVWVVYNHGGSADKAEDLDLRFAYSTNSGVDWTKDQILTGSSLTTGMESVKVSDIEMQPCGTSLDTLWGGTSASYYWKQPPFDKFINMQFEMPADHGGRLDEIEIQFYKAGGSTWGTPDPDLYVWSSDGTYPLDSNPPAGAIAHLHIDYDSIVWYPSYTVIETWDSGIVFDPGEKFHIGYAHAFDPGDTLSILSDDGSMGTSRSSSWNGSAWVSRAPYEFRINALLCPITPPSYDEMAADLEVYRSPSCTIVDLCYFKSTITKGRPLTLDVYYTWAYSTSPGQFHTPHEKNNDHYAYPSTDGREVCQLTFPSGGLPGIVYAGVPPLKSGDENLVDGAWNLYFDYYPWTDVEEDVAEEELPVQFSLSSNYPNPFNPETKIQYTVGSRQIHPLPVTLKIYNILGQLVRTLVDEPKEAGTYEVRWDGRDENGNEVASGVYFYKLQAGDFTQTKKMVLVR